MTEPSQADIVQCRRDLTAALNALRRNCDVWLQGDPVVHIRQAAGWRQERVNEVLAQLERLGMTGQHKGRQWVNMHAELTDEQVAVILAGIGRTAFEHRARTRQDRQRRALIAIREWADATLNPGDIWYFGLSERDYVVIAGFAPMPNDPRDYVTLVDDAPGWLIPREGSRQMIQRIPLEQFFTLVQMGVLWPSHELVIKGYGG